MLRSTLALLMLLAVPALSQGTAPVARQLSSTEYARRLWREVTTYLSKAALDMPDSLYGYAPTPDVRTFGEMLDHLAASQNGYCAMALGQKPSGGGASTGAKTKAQIVEAFRASNEICARAYAQADSATLLPAYEGDRRSRLYVLLDNAMHDNEHYGNIVTYLRLHHMVPPSSQPSPPRP